MWPVTPPPCLYIRHHHCPSSFTPHGTPFRNTKQNHYFTSFQNGTVIFTMKTSTINLSTQCHGTLTHGCCIPPTSPRFPAPDTRGLSPWNIRTSRWRTPFRSRLEDLQLFGKKGELLRGQGQEVGGACRSDWLSYVYVNIYIYSTYVYI